MKLARDFYKPLALGAPAVLKQTWSNVSPGSPDFRAAISLASLLNGASPSRWYSGIPATTKPTSVPIPKFAKTLQHDRRELRNRRTLATL